MKKKTILYAVAIALLVLIFGIFIKLNSNKQVSTINSASDMKKMLKQILLIQKQVNENILKLIKENQENLYSIKIKLISLKDIYLKGIFIFN